MLGAVPGYDDTPGMLIGSRYSGRALLDGTAYDQTSKYEVPANIIRQLSQQQQ